MNKETVVCMYTIFISHSVDCLFTVSIVSFEAHVFNFDEILFICFLLLFVLLMSSKIPLPHPQS